MLLPDIFSSVNPVSPPRGVMSVMLLSSSFKLSKACQSSEGFKIADLRIPDNELC